MSPADSPLIDVTQFGGVAQLRFNRPEALNALNVPMAEEFKAHVDRLIGSANVYGMTLPFSADDLVNGREFDTEHPTRIVNGRDYFFGAGFYFTDDDVKLLLGALPFRF